MRAIGLLLVTALVACGGGSGDGDDDDGTQTDAASDGCPKVWTVRAGADTSASIEDGDLVLSGSSLTGLDLQILRDGLTGDFELDITIESLAAGGSGPFVRVAVTDPISTRGVGGGINSFPDDGVGLVLLPSGPSAFHASTSRPVYVHIERTGARLFMGAGNSENGGAAELTDFPATGPARVWFFLGSFGTVTPLSTARISEFTVTSGTGITSDTFDCDSLIQ